MELLKIISGTMIVSIVIIQISCCSPPKITRPSIDRYEFENVDKLIAKTAKIADCAAPTTGEYSFIRKYELENKLSRIRSGIRLLPILVTARSDMLRLCDIIEEWLSYLAIDSCNGIFIRISRYIFEVYDLYDIASSIEVPYEVLSAYVAEIIEHMTLPGSITSDLNKRENTLDNIRDILRSIDDHMLESLNESLMRYRSAECLRVIRSIKFIHIFTHDIGLTIMNCYLTSYNLTYIYSITRTLYKIYDSVINRQFVDIMSFCEISKSNYSYIYMIRTNRIHYIRNISDRIIYELTFYCEEMMNESCGAVTQKIVHLSILLGLIHNFKKEIDRTSHEIIILFDDAYQLCWRFLRVIQSDNSPQDLLLKTYELGVAISNVIILVYEKCGYKIDNLRYFFNLYRKNPKALLYVPNESTNTYQLKNYCLQFSLAKIIWSNELTKGDSPKYIFTTFLKLNNLYFDVNEADVQEIIDDMKNKLPEAYNFYLCSFISFADSLHKVEDVL